MSDDNKTSSNGHGPHAPAINNSPLNRSGAVVFSISRSRLPIELIDKHALYHLNQRLNDVLGPLGFTVGDMVATATNEAGQPITLEMTDANIGEYYQACVNDHRDPIKQAAKEEALARVTAACMEEDLKREQEADQPPQAIREIFARLASIAAGNSPKDAADAPAGVPTGNRVGFFTPGRGSSSNQ